MSELMNIKRLTTQKEYFQYVNEYVKGNNDGSQVSVLFGDLAFMYAFDQYNESGAYGFAKKLLIMTPYINEYLINHISNFIEILLVYYPQLIKQYICLLQNIGINDINKTSKLYKSIIVSVLKHEYDIDKILENIPHKWECYYEVSNYYLYFNNLPDAKKYICKALKTCPEHLKDKYYKKKEYIIENYSF